MHTAAKYYATNIAVEVDEIRAADLIRAIGLKPRAEILYFPNPLYGLLLSGPELSRCFDACPAFFSSGKVEKILRLVGPRDAHNVPSGLYLIDMPSQACDPKLDICIEEGGITLRLRRWENEFPGEGDSSKYDCQIRTAALYHYEECHVVVKNPYDEALILYKKTVDFPNSYTFFLLKNVPDEMRPLSVVAELNWIKGEATAMDYGKFESAFLKGSPFLKRGE